MDRDMAEDLTQNVFLRMIKYRSSYREGNQFMPWIYQLARKVNGKINGGGMGIDIRSDYGKVYLRKK